MSITSMEDIKRLAAIAEEILNGKEFLLGSVSERLHVAASKYPHDQAVRNMQLIIDNKVSKMGKAAIISQAELQTIYDDLSGLGNRAAFQEELGDLLLEDRRAKVANYNDNYVSGLRDSGTDMDIVNRDEVSEYEAMWNGDHSNAVRASFIENGKRGVKIELASLGFSNPTVEVVTSDKNFVVYAAEVDSRHGRVPFLIPAEVKLGTVLMPSVFVSGKEFVDLTPENLRAYVNNARSIQRHAAPKDVLNHLNKLIKGAQSATISDSDDYHVHVDNPGLFMEFVGHTDKDIQHTPIEYQAPMAKMPEALVGLSDSMIQETLLEAGLSFPRELIVTAKTVVSNELKIAGIEHDAITVSSEFDYGVVLATNIVGKGGRKKIEVPVEIKDSRVLMPSSFISGAMAGPFESEEIKAFAHKIDNAEFDPMLTDKYSMGYADLHKLAMKKAAYGDFIEATEVLSVINDKFGSELHRMAHHDLMELMRIGYSPENNAISAIDKFAEDLNRKAQDEEYKMKIVNNPMLFYPSEG